MATFSLDVDKNKMTFKALECGRNFDQTRSVVNVLNSDIVFLISLPLNEIFRRNCIYNWATILLTEFHAVNYQTIWECRIICAVFSVLLEIYDLEFFFKKFINVKH